MKKKKRRSRKKETMKTTEVKKKRVNFDMKLSAESCFHAATVPKLLFPDTSLTGRTR